MERESLHRPDSSGSPKVSARRRCRLDAAICCLLGLAACAGSEVAVLPGPPQVEEQEPPFGRVLRLELEEAGRPLLLEAVVGRVTLLCVLADGGEAIVDACRSARLLWGDRIAVVGLSTSTDPPRAPFRVYQDPSGEALQELLSSRPVSAVILTDRRGRIRELLELDRLGALDSVLDDLVG